MSVCGVAMFASELRVFVFFVSFACLGAAWLRLLTALLKSVDSHLDAPAMTLRDRSSRCNLLASFRLFS